ncbi:MAG: hypothetical protein M1818_000909 [Claussenomyces sp. TS43310]|nr:MAG: hypothetical protein M1818_000909 [Claussenomyces sp. TS43310]
MEVNVRREKSGATETLFFLFYFNRLFATIVSYGLRAWTWHKYRVYIDIQALQISLLGGRVFFKGLRYHGNNETIFIHSGYITWSYWLRKVRELDLDHQAVQKQHVSCNSDSNGSTPETEDKLAGMEKGGRRSPAKLPCRLTATIKGLEWFVYNRSAAYDGIIDSMSHEDSDDSEGIAANQANPGGVYEGLKHRSRGQESGDSGTIPTTDPSSLDKPSYRVSSNGKDVQSQDSIASEPSSSILSTKLDNNGVESNIFLQFLPIHIDCTKAAVVLGNENTRSVLITKVEKFSGEIDATSCRGPDNYRQLINLQFERPVVQIKPNDDYKEDQTAAASRVKEGFTRRNGPKDGPTHHHSFIHRQQRKVWHKLQIMVPYFRSSVESFSSSLRDEQAAQAMNLDANQWQGLSRYLDESEQDDKARWSSIEYATVSTIIDSPRASINYYWDIPGVVPSSSVERSTSHKSNNDTDEDVPPAWGLDLSISGATINYGPWADRQRADLQRIFFPSLCKDSKPAQVLNPGQTRVATRFKLYVQLDEETVLRVPIREESKNWQWKKQADTMGDRSQDQRKRFGFGRKGKADKGIPTPEIRPFGWLDVKVAANSTISYDMDMVANLNGYSTKLELDFPQVEITTSVNHGLLWKSVNQRIACDLSNPLRWNGLRTWKFDVISNGLEMFILREHIFLLIDLVDDWASGPPPEYLTFTPFRYLLNLQFDSFRVYLNCNDSNIINNPSDFDDNTFLILFGTTLNANLCIPLDRYRPHRNAITFDVKANTGGLNLHVPPWNTQATFLDSTEIAQLKDLGVSGRYQYCSTTAASNTDTLILDIHGRSLQVDLYGFVIRCFLKFKENYFGDSIHFKTLDEYQQILHSEHQNPDADSAHGISLKVSNDLDVILRVNADNSCFRLPANLYSAKNNVRIEVPELALDLRFTNYYMDMQLKLCPLALSLGSEESGTATPITSTSSSQLFIDGIDVFGHRVFGLPPSETTYVCNWDFAVGSVSGECSTEFLGRVVAGIRALAFSFDDDENALPSISEVKVHDITFLRAFVDPVRVWLHVEEAAFLLSTGTIQLSFDDWAGLLYSKKLKLSIPDIVLACVDAESASRHRSRHNHPVETHAYLKTSVAVTMIDRKCGFAKDRYLQQLHVRREDSRTHRADFLLHASVLEDVAGGIPGAVDPPAMCFPRLPTSLSYGSRAGMDAQSGLSVKPSSHPSSEMRRTTSFLSATSSSSISQKSVLHSHSSLSVHRNHSNHPRPREESRSRSRQAGRSQPRVRHPRDLSASTGRQASIHSATGEYRGRQWQSPSNVAFSSAYTAPYFPLETVEPDLKNVPNMDYDELITDDITVNEHLYQINPEKFNEQTSYTSFIIELKQDVRAYCTPPAVRAVARLLEAMQAIEPNDITDVLQINSMTDISILEKKKHQTGTNVDVKLDIPHAQLRFASSASSSAGRGREIDRYDISLHSLAVTARSGVVPDDTDGVSSWKDTSALHVRLRSLNISAKECLDNMDDAQAAIDGGVEDVNFWMASRETRTASLKIKVAGLATTSRKIEYLASLLHRTMQLGSEFGDIFSSLYQQQANRVKLFALLIAKAGSPTPDPLFLTRPSYVLRSATDHLRTNASWKLVTRLRHVYMRIDRTKRNFILESLRHNETCPDNARQEVLAGFDQWRNWDLSDITKSMVMQNIFGPPSKNDAQEMETPIRLTFFLDSLNLVLDPGPKQNEVVMMALSINAAIEPPLVEDNGHSGLTLRGVRSTIIETYCENASLNLNWDLCELATDLLKLYNRGQTESALKTLKPSQTNHKPSGPPNQVHIVIVTEKGSITLDTINIRTVLISEGLKASLIMIEDPVENTSSVSVVLAAQAASSRLLSHSQELMICQLRSPSVNMSYVAQRASGVASNDWKIAANAGELSYIVRQDTLDLLEIVDLLVGDELAQIKRLSLEVPARQTEEPHQSASTSEITNRINVALFLDNYHISLPLLPSLTYHISGVVARASLAARMDLDFVFDFDVKEHAHDIKTLANNKPHIMSLLRMPPTNGRVTNHVGLTEHTISVFASIESVELDAAAIHGLLTALNRPEISSVVAQVRHNVNGIQQRFDEVYGSTKQPSPKLTTPTSKPFVYDAHVTLAGLNIYAESTGGKGNQNTARLSFQIGCVQFEATNRRELSGPVLELPETRIRLRHILFELNRLSADGMEPCGNFAFEACFTATSKKADNDEDVRSYHIESDDLEINLFAETASTIVDVACHLQDRIKDLDLPREVQYLQNLRKPHARMTESEDTPESVIVNTEPIDLFSSMYSVELLKIQISWIVSAHSSLSREKDKEDLVLSCKRIGLSTSRGHSAKLTIEDLQLQMVPASHDKGLRSQNSALLPQVIFNVASVTTKESRRLAFQAAGKSLDLRLTSQFILPAADLKRSIGSAADKVRLASASWNSSSVPAKPAQPVLNKRKPFFGTKRMESLLVDADFAGAIVHLQNIRPEDSVRRVAGFRSGNGQQSGRYGQFAQEDPSNNTVLRAPGLACKVEYKDDGHHDPSMNAEVKIDASTNIFFPAVVPLIMEISSSVTEMVSSEDQAVKTPGLTAVPQRSMTGEEDNILTTDPSAVLGRTSLNLGVRVCRQEFTLSCQPIARVAATGRFDDIYVTINTVRTLEHGHFFAMTAAVNQLQASVQHIYSRESTGSFEVDSIVLSLMNSRHLGGTTGLSAILNVSPMKVLVNAKQLQDFLLFREIWVPPELRRSSEVPVAAASATQSQTYLVQRYQQVAATGAFPWNTTVSIAELDVQLDLGQAIGKSSYVISGFWVSSKKTSDWEQNLCLGFEKVGVDSTGRMSGFVSLQDLKVRTSIQWPEREKALNQTPLIQASLKIGQLRLKASFDYQPFLVADITLLELLMFNIHHGVGSKGDRLVSTINGDSVQVFCTTLTASQTLALYQAFLRLIQEKRTNYETSLREIERFMRRKSTVPAPTASYLKPVIPSKEAKKSKSPISLHTHVVVMLKALNIGAFPATFYDQQVFKIEALNACARFTASMDNGQIHSGLGLTLGQLRIGLAGVKRPAVLQVSGDVTVDEVLQGAVGSRGGTILKVPKVEALMETWQIPDTNHIDYVFKSSFEGKVEVGWNYSRISYIRGMYANHVRALAQRLGKPLPPSAVKITGVPQPDEDGNVRKEDAQQKITAEVVMPLSKYEYYALQPPVIETPQLRDMGEATPPLEWIGLHRDRLPNLTHQIVIVTLLEVVSEVEDAYSKILGSS